jgi:D-alanyl-D-alanine carboxypeptidase (penicillin-binding protein 5/6)
VLLGSTTEAGRAQESLRLLNWGYQTFDSVKLFRAGDTVRALDVWKGSAPTVNAGPKSDLFVAVPRGEADKLKAELVSEQPLLAPLARGQRVGTLRVALDGKPVAEFPLVALEPIAQAGLLGRAWDTLRLWIK